MNHIAILGRLPRLSIAELEQVYGAQAITPLSQQVCLVKNAAPDVQRLGGITKAGRIVARFSAHSWSEVSKEIVRLYTEKWQHSGGKQTLGISVYEWNVSPRDIQKTGLTLKSSLKRRSVSLRLIPQTESALNTATSHHNKLGLSDNKTELLIVKSQKQVIVAESTGAQNITALARRDQGRPKRDAFVGMLPPKLALMMINLSGAHATEPLVTSSDETSAAQERQGAGALVRSWSEAVSKDDGDEKANKIARETPKENDSGVSTSKSSKHLLDPFCGTGVVLQEAALLGFDVYGTDLSDKMIDYSTENLAWLKDKYNLASDITIHQGDAMTTSWQPPVDAIVCETYLGQPFSAPPSPKKLQEVRGNCNHIISTFLKNLASQIPSGTPLCLAVPAWRDTKGQLTHLPLTTDVEKFGYKTVALTHVKPTDLVYFREDQVVARQLLLLTRA